VHILQNFTYYSSLDIILTKQTWFRKVFDKSTQVMVTVHDWTWGMFRRTTQSFIYFFQVATPCKNWDEVPKECMKFMLRLRKGLSCHDWGSGASRSVFHTHDLCYLFWGKWYNLVLIAADAWIGSRELVSFPSWAESRSLFIVVSGEDARGRDCVILTPFVWLSFLFFFFCVSTATFDSALFDQEVHV
jgi:hypothetical protein